MSVNNIQANVQNTEQYKIRKQTETKQAEELQSQIQQAEQAAQEIRQVDEYDKANEKSNEPKGGAAPTATSSTDESSDDDDDDELEKLKEQRDSIKQQLNREVDENVKAALRAQLQSIEMQIALKSSGTD